MTGHKSLGRLGCGRSKLALLASVLAALVLHSAEAAPNVVLWDTSSRFGEKVDLVARDAWKAVPRDLLTLENDPAKASSDPGYYGREYTFKGDVVVENHYLAA